MEQGVKAGWWPQEQSGMPKILNAAQGDFAAEWVTRFGNFGEKRLKSWEVTIGIPAHHHRLRRKCWAAEPQCD